MKKSWHTWEAHLASKISSILCVLVFGVVFAVGPADGEVGCVDGNQEGADGQPTKSIYRICQPPEELRNGSLVIWAHGFQDVSATVGIPEDQLTLGDGVSIPDLVTSLGFDFATNSYRKTGLAIVQGAEDIFNLVQVYTEVVGEQPDHIYLVGASEGGIITTLLVEQHPEVFDAGLALCGPVGDFPFQIDYFGNARVTFEYFFPGLLPAAFECSGDQVQVSAEAWTHYFNHPIKPRILSLANRSKLNQWVNVAKLPFDANDYLGTVAESAQDVLGYSMINLKDAAAVLGGFPFDNSRTWYWGSSNDLRLNLLVKRCRADSAAITEMKKDYNTSGLLQQPVITMHTLRDQQIPFVHEPLYTLKTISRGSFLTEHINIPINRYGHCNFTLEETLFSFGLMLFYAGDLDVLAGVGAILQGPQIDAFKQMAQEYGLPYSVEGDRLKILRK
jgi:pimeloyl-ACP methyl ester carboxylesterase